MNTGQLLDQILEHEGGYIDHPADKGGPTNHGITLKSLTEYLERPATLAELQALDASQARNIYAELYIRRPGFNQIADARLRALVVDCGVNQGRKRATRWLQAAARVKADGMLGPITAQAVNNADPFDLAVDVLATRIRSYGELIAGDYRNRRAAVRLAQTLSEAQRQVELMQAVFAGGWCNRAADFLQPLKEDS